MQAADRGSELGQQPCRRSALNGHKKEPPDITGGFESVAKGSANKNQEQAAAICCPAATCGKTHRRAAKSAA